MSGVRPPCFPLGNHIGLWGIFQAGRGAEKETGLRLSNVGVLIQSEFISHINGFLLLRNLAKTHLVGN